MSTLINSRKNEDTLAMAIVDADAPTCQAFADWVRQTGGVCCAGIHADAESALAALPVEKPQIVLLEIQLAGMNWIESLGYLKRCLPATHFIIYTHSIAPDHVFKAMAAGATGYFLKSIPLVELLPAIQKNYPGNLLARNAVARKVLESFQHFITASAATTFPKRQQEVLDLLVQGRSTLEIAQAMRIDSKTVDTHIRRIFRKLGVHSRAQAVAKITRTRELKIIGSNPASVAEPGPAGQQAGFGRIRRDGDINFHSSLACLGKVV